MYLKCGTQLIGAVSGAGDSVGPLRRLNGP